LVTDERTEYRWTKGQIEMPPASKNKLKTDKNKLAGGIAFVCFYDAECALRMITKFLVHLLLLLLLRTFVERKITINTPNALTYLGKGGAGRVKWEVEGVRKGSGESSRWYGQYK